MSRIFISGYGAVSPAGWGLPAMRDAIAKGSLPQARALCRPGTEKPLDVRQVPSPNPRPAFLSHPRLRRASSISQYALGAALEACATSPGALDQKCLGVIVCIFSGCVHYSRPFYDETLKDPSTASPLLFPETVFNSPASHISAYLGSTAINYTLIGDSGTFLQALALAAAWLDEKKVTDCLVVGTEEVDWLTPEATRLFDRTIIPSEGAGAIVLSTTPTQVELKQITDEFLYSAEGKATALTRMKEALGPFDQRALLLDSTSGSKGIFQEEDHLWSSWPNRRVSPKQILGEGLMAGAAWECVLAADELKNSEAAEAIVSVAGFHQHAIGARFAKVF